VLFLFAMWLVLTARDDGSKLLPPYLRTKMGIHKDKQIIAPSPKPPPQSDVTIVFISLLFIASTAWYAYTSQGAIVLGVLGLGSQISGSIADLFNPTYSQALHALAQGPASGILHQINAFVNYLNQFLILAGVCLVIFLKEQRFKLQSSYVVLSTIALGVLIASVAIPYLAVLNADRVYSIMMIFLAPFLAIGFIKIGETAGVTMSKVKSKLGFGNSALVSPSRLTRLLAIYLVLFMLFQNGFIFALTESSQSFLLNNQVNGPEFNHQEIVAATWQTDKSGGQVIYGDLYETLLIRALAPEQGQYLPPPQNTSAGGLYVFLGTYNIEHNQAQISSFSGVNPELNYTNVTPFISNRSLIYSNGGADVYL